MFSSIASSILKKLAGLICISLVVLIGISMGVLCSIFENNITEQKNEALHELSKVTVESLYFAMSEGSTDVEPFLEKAKQIDNIVDLTVIPSGLIDSDAAKEMDREERAVLSSKEKKYMLEEYNETDVFRAVEPVIADESCLSCHEGGVGDVLAVISIRYSMADTFAFIYNQRVLSVILIMASIGLIAVILIYVFKRNFLADLFSSIDAIKKLSQGRVDFELRSNLRGTRTDEIGTLISSVSALQENFGGQAQAVHEMANGNLAVEIEQLSDGDKLGIAINEIKKSLNNLSDDVKTLAVAAYHGELKVRVDAAKHKGVYNKIVTGFNETFDHLIKPINEGVAVLGKVAQGDLTVKIESEYKGDHGKIKQSINQLVNSLNNVIASVARAVQSTRDSSSTISSSSEQMAAGAQEQLLQIQEIASAIEEMARTSLETANNSSVVSNSAKDAGSYATEGVSKLANAKNGMKDISDSAKQTSELISSLASQSVQIGSIAQVIDDIADQTNLLALNAAIEAARAGEQGRGFAVVADEVRKLAERTTKATKEIADTIKTIQSEARKANDSMADAKNAVNNGIRNNEDLEESLRKILNSTESVISQIEQVASAIEEQSSTSEQISRNISSINNVTNENTSGIQGIAHAAENLNSLTEGLYNLVRHFKISSESSTKTEVYQSEFYTN
ncbi:MAG: hypothetical protein JW995_08330 [Melioribacteraceae bacterium]|nr:hypothetical protein [Melioribacteraceae bacterium]